MLTVFLFFPLCHVTIAGDLMNTDAEDSPVCLVLTFDLFPETYAAAPIWLAHSQIVSPTKPSFLQEFEKNNCKKTHYKLNTFENIISI